ncbi:hypothetical protein ACWCQQ_51230, partial [Streptomyces sp. NPDC002143]
MEGEGVQVGFGLEQVRELGAAGQGPDGLAAFAQRTDERAGDLADGRAVRAGTVVTEGADACVKVQGVTGGAGGAHLDFA